MKSKADVEQYLKDIAKDEMNVDPNLELTATAAEKLFNLGLS